MPWENVTLNDGHSMPTIAFGTAGIGNGDGPVQNVKTAINVGFTHVDTAQSYRNEVEAGKALSAFPRDKVFLTTKYSGVDGLDIPTSIKNSLKNLGTSYVDLYLIHSPRLARPDIKTVWAQMEAVKAAGFARSIGVSNFNDSQLAELLEHANVTPAANQILLHPYVYKDQMATMAFCAKHDIVVEAYSALLPLRRIEGPVRGVVATIAEREKVAPEQVLLAWVKAKGAVAVTTSSKQDRLEGYLKAGDLALSTLDLAAIDDAGVRGAPSLAAAPASAPAYIDEKTPLYAHETTVAGLPLPVSVPVHAASLAWRARMGQGVILVGYFALGWLFGRQLARFAF